MARQCLDHIRAWRIDARLRLLKESIASLDGEAKRAAMAEYQ